MPANGSERTQCTALPPKREPTPPSSTRKLELQLTSPLLRSLPCYSVYITENILSARSCLRSYCRFQAVTARKGYATQRERDDFQLHNINMSQILRCPDLGGGLFWFLPKMSLDYFPFSSYIWFSNLAASSTITKNEAAYAMLCCVYISPGRKNVNLNPGHWQSCEV